MFQELAYFQLFKFPFFFFFLSEAEILDMGHILAQLSNKVRKLNTCFVARKMAGFFFSESYVNDYNFCRVECNQTDRILFCSNKFLTWSVYEP